MRKKLLRLCSLILVFVSVFQMPPIGSFAVEGQESGGESASGNISLSAGKTDAEDVSVIGEITEHRGEFTKELTLTNGLRMAAVYPVAVHYQAEGQWQEIDNTLKAVGTGSNGHYTNTAGIWNVRFPQQLSESNDVAIQKDGYTLRFWMAGELRRENEQIAGTGEASPATASGDGEAFREEDPASVAADCSVTAVRNSGAQVQTVDTASMKAEAQYAELVPEKLYSRLVYSNVYGNTNVVYDLESNQLKESIVLARYDSALRGYRYTLDVGELVPVLAEDGRIDFRSASGGETVMVMPAPYMMDAAGAHTGDVDVLLEAGADGRYTLTYLLPQAWLAEDGRAWPVVLDPVVAAKTTTRNIEDQTVWQKKEYDYQWGMLECGYGANDGVARFFVGYRELPALTSADVIVDASIALFKYGSGDSTIPVEVHKVNSTWAASSLTWSNKPSYNTNIEDFAIVRDAGWYRWDVTDIVREWYAGSNTGMMFKAPDAVEASTTPNWKQFYSCNFSDYAYNPTLVITFRNNSGLESYWDYTASSAGRAGTGYINNYTGNLVWVREDIGFGGNRMPVSIRHVYNANDCATDLGGMGCGWRTNFHQRVYQWSENSSYYVWEDADGTRHYFYYSSSGIYQDEDGLELTLTTTGSGTSKYCIADKYGNKSYFDTYGRLTKQQNNQQTASSITITYGSGNSSYIMSITDGAGRIYKFAYPGGRLTKISYHGTGSTELAYVLFVYSGSHLTTVTDMDGKVSRFTYTTDHLLSSVQDVDGYQLTYSYNTIQAGKPSRISKVCEYSGSTAGGELNIEYAHNQTTLRDVDGNVRILQFNNWGNTVSVQDGEGHAQYARYAADTAASGKGNQLTIASKLQNTVGNVLRDGSFENGTLWSNLSSASNAVTTSVAYQGKKSLAVTCSAGGSASGAYSPAFTVGAGETYTFSAYVKTGTGAAYLALHDGSTTVTSEALAANSGWTRLEVHYTNSTASAKSVTARLLTEGTGTVYMDCAQVEKAPTASRYNLVENGDFRYGTYGWSGLSASNVVSGSAAAPELEGSVCALTGTPQGMRQVSQTVAVSGGKGDTYVVSGWARGDAAPITGYQPNPRSFAIELVFNNTDGTKTTVRADFNPDTAEWQYTAAPAVAEKAYSNITVRIAYDYNVNTVWFDGIQLYKEEFGSSYTYDGDGNVVSVKDLQGQTTRYEYTNNNLTRAILPTGAKLSYTYDNYHNVKTATTETGVAYSFGYDAYGNNTSVSILSGSGAITGTAAYTSDGNRLSSTTDAAGKTTTYSYNENTNVLEWVQYPRDSSATRTNYTYDSMYRLASASANVGGLSTGSALTAGYTYTNDHLTSIQTGSTTYTFTYGNFALRSSIAIGSRTLASYSYTGRNNDLSALDYGNGDSVNYTYDKQGRVTKQTYEDGVTISYQYDNDGALATVTDSATGRATTYYYDFTNRLMKTVESGSGYNHSVGYGYDSVNNLTSLVEIINDTVHTTAYAYDKDNRVTAVTNGSGERSYTYDGYSRVSGQTTKHNGAVVLTDAFTYRPSGSSGTTGQVETHRITSSGYNKTYTYSYDNNGNITSVKYGAIMLSYVYDSANQLIRENNQAARKTWTYTYDNGGNITGKKEYAYTTGTLGSPTDTVTYTYGDGSWGDLLTSYDGAPITSDGIGNMLTDGTWEYTWEHGRQLAGMSSSFASWNFTYDANGVRTSRTNGSQTYRYVYNSGKLRQMTVDEHTLYFAYDANGNPFSVTFDDEKYYYVTNIQGDVIGILTEDGQEAADYYYSAWGEVYGQCRTPIGDYNPLRYRGYVYDNETGLYYLQSRYYNPELGRFINADDVDLLGANGDFASLNLFAYCGNNPVSREDPNGGFWVTAGLMAVGGLIGAAISAVSSAVTQQALTGTVNWKSVGVAAASGFVSGAVAASPLGIVGQQIAGGVIGGLSYAADCYVNDKSMKLDEAILSVGMGVISGRIGGAGANEKMALSNAANSAKQTIARETRRANQQYAQKVITAAISSRNNTFASTAWVASFRFAAGSGVSNGVTGKYSSLGLFPNAPTWKPW